MKILLTNDDGINAEGLQKLLQTVLPLGHELAMVAPKRNNSGAGHSITLWREVEIRELDPLPGLCCRWHVDGTPVDSVKFALGNGIIRPDLIVSGINNGPNMGRNTHYSGTVGAALEGLFHGISSVALSVQNWSEPLWEPAVHIGRQIIFRALQEVERRSRDGEPFLLNANFPDLPCEKIKGVRLTRQGVSGFAEKFYPSKGGEPHHYFLAGEITQPDTDPYIDSVAVDDGYVSVTPLNTQMTCNQSLQEFSTGLLDGIEVR